MVIEKRMGTLVIVQLVVILTLLTSLIHGALEFMAQIVTGDIARITSCTSGFSGGQTCYYTVVGIVTFEVHILIVSFVWIDGD